MTANTTILEAKNLLVRRGGVVVLDIADLFVEHGEVLSLIGPNGAGKSSLLLALAHLITVAEGDILFRGEAVHNGNGLIAYRRKVAMVFQEPLLFDATVRRNVAAGLKIRGMARNVITERVNACLDLFGISHLADRHARTLSGGEAQRTSLARAFAIHPEIIFLDEPFSSLDPPTREGLIDDLQRILKKTKTAAVMATHDRIEALRLSHRIAVMKAGQLIQVGRPEEIMNHPINEFVAAFTGTETALTGKVTGYSAGTVIIRLPGGTEIEAVGNYEPGQTVTCFIRPEHVTLSLGTLPGGQSARNVFSGTIDRIVPLGLFYRVSLNCGFSLTAYVTAPSLDHLGLREGKTIYASFKATAAHVVIVN